MIDVRRYGNRGPCVVLLHGGPGAPGSMAALARTLSDRFRVLEPLQRTSGGEPLTVATHVADLHDVLQRAEDSVQIVGHSWGAMLALTFAARHPQRVTQLILVGCGTFDEESRAVYQHRMQLRLSSADTSRWESLEFRLGEETDAARRNILFAEIAETGLRAQAVDPLTTDLEAIVFDEQGYRESWSDALQLQQENVQPEEFRNIKVPVLMLHGEDDPHPGRMIRASLAPFIPHISYREFCKCGHVPWLELYAKNKFLAALSAALDGQPPS